MIDLRIENGQTTIRRDFWCTTLAQTKHDVLHSVYEGAISIVDNARHRNHSIQQSKMNNSMGLNDTITLDSSKDPPPTRQDLEKVLIIVGTLVVLLPVLYLWYVFPVPNRISK